MKKLVKSCWRQFATNARKSVSCTRFLSNYNEAHYYSELFHLIKGACKAGQIESLESFYCILENSQPALTDGLMFWKASGWSGNLPDGLEIFQMAWKVSRWSGKFSGGLDSFQVVWTVSRWLETFPDGLDRFQMIWTVSSWPGQFPDGLESFQMAWKDSRWSGQFPDGLDSFHMAWKVSRWPGKIPDGLKSFHMVWKLSMFTKTFQVYKNFPGSIATLLPWFFRL